jgi:hypothetical protein
VTRWLCVLILAGGAAFAGDDAALRAVDACRARLDPRADIGIERVQRRCPELLPALDRAPWRELLPHTMRERREELSADSLRALAELVRRSAVQEERRAAPDLTKLAPVLAALGAEGQEGVTRWERFKKWLKDKFDGRKDERRNWADDLSRKLETSEGIAQIITYAGYALVAGLVLYVIWAEVRAAGLFGAVRRAARRQNPAAEWRRQLLLADVAAAPLAERPGMLLRLLGEALTRAHRLPASAGMTAGAISRRAELESPEERAELTSVARVADEVRYAPTTPPDDLLASTVERAKALLGQFARLGKN